MLTSRLLGLLGPYHQYAISTFNTCSRGSTHRSLTNTGGGYNLRGAGFPQTTPRPSQPTITTLHLRAPSNLRLSIEQFPAKPRGYQTLTLTSGSLQNFYCNISSNATTVPYNSHKVNAQIKYNIKIDSI
jgi:hypothetical protein